MASDPNTSHESEMSARRRFAARLTHARRTAGLNQTQAAKANNIPVDRLREIEGSLIWPTSDELDMMADKYGVPANWLTCTPPFDL